MKIKIWTRASEFNHPVCFPLSTFLFWFKKPPGESGEMWTRRTEWVVSCEQEEEEEREMSEDTTQSYHHLYYSAHADPAKELEKLNQAQPGIKLPSSPSSDEARPFTDRWETERWRPDWTWTPFQSIYGGENCDSKQERTPEEQQPAVVTNQLHLHHHHQPAQLPQQAGGEQAEVLLQLLLSPFRLLLCSSGLSGRNLLGCPCLQVK